MKIRPKQSGVQTLAWREPKAHLLECRPRELALDLVAALPRCDRKAPSRRRPHVIKAAIKPSGIIMHGAACADFNAEIGVVRAARPKEYFNTVLRIHIVFPVRSRGCYDISVAYIEREDESFRFPEKPRVCGWRCFG